MSSVPAEGPISQTVTHEMPWSVFEDWEGLGRSRKGQEAEGREVSFQVPHFL